MRFRKQAEQPVEQPSSTCCSWQPGEKITAVIPIKDYRDGWYLFMATKKGIVKKTAITDYANVRKTGLAAITLREDDELIEVKFTDDITGYFPCDKIWSVYPFP